MDVKLEKWHKCQIDKEILKELSKKSDLKGLKATLRGKKPVRGATTPHDNAAPRPKTPRHTRKDDGLCAAQSVRRRNGDRPPATASAHARA